jgi:hypothetical protein
MEHLDGEHQIVAVLRVRLRDVGVVEHHAVGDAGGGGIPARGLDRCRVTVEAAHGDAGEGLGHHNRRPAAARSNLGYAGGPGLQSRMDVGQGRDPRLRQMGEEGRLGESGLHFMEVVCLVGHAPATLKRLLLLLLPASNRPDEVSHRCHVGHARIFEQDMRLRRRQ